MLNHETLGKLTEVDIAKLISRYSFQFSDEYELQDAIEQILTNADVEFQKEHYLGKGERIDFLVGTTGIEIKVSGGSDAVWRQLKRYFKYDEIDSILLITSRATHQEIAKADERVEVLVVQRMI